MADKNLLIGQAALALGVPESTLRALTDNGTLAVPRVGRMRVFPADKLDVYRRTLERAGYLPARPAVLSELEPAILPEVQPLVSYS